MSNEKTKLNSRRSAISIMVSLIGLVKPLIHIMLVAIILGTIGYLCAIFLTILATQIIVSGLLTQINEINVSISHIWLQNISAKTIITVMIVIAVLRGILHYVEQYCNHFIAFKLLAIIRHKVFAALRKLCPAKLEGRDKGNLISIITTDIELLEVFYAHTISPIAIAILTSSIMIIFIGSYSVWTGIFATIAYLIIGVLIPMINGKKGSSKGMEFRTNFGELNSFVLDSLRGLDETIQYGQGEIRKNQMSYRSGKLAKMQRVLNKMEGVQRAVTNIVILLASFGMLILTVILYHLGNIGFDGVLTCTVAMMGSFGPVVALSSLSNNLNQTLASGERVLSILEEKPLVQEIVEENPTLAYTENKNRKDFATESMEDENVNGLVSESIEDENVNGLVSESVENGNVNDLLSESVENGNVNGLLSESIEDENVNGLVSENVEEENVNSLVSESMKDGFKSVIGSGKTAFTMNKEVCATDKFKGAGAKSVTFAYENETILDEYSIEFEPGIITGIHGASGSGKSTLLKLLMRFWDVNKGKVFVDNKDVRKITTKHLRDMESYVTQETHLFHDSIANNISIAKPDATMGEIMEAAKKASIHDFIMSLPNGYDTEVGELGDTLSGGEKQRIGIARAFLHDAPLILMDEPTSNLDSLNEGIILKSLKESAKEKTVVLVSHRASTMNIADVVYEMDNERIS